MVPLKTIVVFGGGLAGHLTALALSTSLPSSIEIIFVKISGAESNDLFYGNVTSPSTYDVLLSLGVTEPELLLTTNTTFSLGTRFENWGPQKRNWTQAFHRPLPIHHGVKFHHYVNRHSSGKPDWSIAPYIMSVEAANKGVFAHPPEGKNIPLETVEYGYHFDPDEWTKLLSNHLNNKRVKIIETDSTQPFNPTSGQASALLLTNGQEVKGDLFIDCSRQSQSCADDNQTEKRELVAHEVFKPQDKIGSVVRSISQTNYGWRSNTPLKHGIKQTIFCAPEDKARLKDEFASEATAFASTALGRIESPWTSNVIKLGHSAGALEPLTPAPMMMLQQDIQRLIDLIPTSQNMSVEAREYNRRYAQDFDNAVMFNRALLTTPEQESSSYLNAETAIPMSAELQTKITQFESRGVCVTYDNELFNEQDWTLMHIGMGRLPARYDPLTTRVQDEQIAQMLSNMSRAVTQMAAKMPPHNVYMTGLLKFLKEKHG